MMDPALLWFNFPHKDLLCTSHLPKPGMVKKKKNQQTDLSAKYSSRLQFSLLITSDQMESIPQYSQRSNRWTIMNEKDTGSKQ